MLAACGGGDSQDSTAPVGAPHAVVKAGKPTGAAAVAVHLYQALYGKAPSYALMTDYTAQATADAATFAGSLAGTFASTSHADLAKLVLDNLGVTATTVKAVNSKGESEYAILLDAVQQIFAAFPTLRGQVILNMTNLLEGLEADATYGAAAVAYNNQASANQTYATNPVNTSSAVVSVGGAGATTQMGGSIQGKALALSSTVSSFAGVNSATFGAVDGVGTAATFLQPNGITTDGTNLYVINESGLIRKIVIATATVSTLGSAGGGSEAITTDGTNLYIAQMFSILKVSIATGAKSYLAGGAATMGYADGTGAAAKFFMSVGGVTTDGINLYVSDFGNNRIRKVVIATGEVTTVAGSGAKSSVDGVGVAASFSQPYGIATDGVNLFVGEYDTGKIRKLVIATGAVSTLAGSVSRGAVNGTGSGASFTTPSGLSTDGTYVFIADRDAQLIRKIEIATGVVTDVAGGRLTSNTALSGNTDGVGTAAKFYAPTSITTDGKSLYVADLTNNKIRKID
jgi:hypothetical protein